MQGGAPPGPCGRAERGRAGGGEKRCGLQGAARGAVKVYVLDPAGSGGHWTLKGSGLCSRKILRAGSVGLVYYHSPSTQLSAWHTAGTG